MIGDPAAMDKLLTQLVERLKEAYGERLVSVVLYGSAAGGDYDAKFSDLNVVCVLAEISAGELAHAVDLFRWWREQGNPSPLLMTPAELAECTDCFPIEFADIARHYRVLHGRDVIAGLRLPREYYRAQLEHDLRAKLFRLRQKAAGAYADADLLRRLLADSVSTFCVLFRHALTLTGVEAPRTKCDVIQHARDKFGIDPLPFERLLDLRQQRLKPRDVDPHGLLAPYLESISRVIDAVDRFETS
jgi:predicted nucleotidyltransferase